MKYFFKGSNFKSGKIILYMREDFTSKNNLNSFIVHAKKSINVLLIIIKVVKDHGCLVSNLTRFTCQR